MPGALLVGVDAKEGQRVLFVVNDGDILDTTVGVEIEQSLPQTDPAVDAEDQRAMMDLCLTCGRPRCIKSDHDRLDKSIRAGQKLADAATRTGDHRDPMTVISDAIANLLLHAADAYGVDAAQDVAEAAHLHFYGDWTEAGRPWGADDPELASMC